MINKKSKQKLKRLSMGVGIFSGLSIFVIFAAVSVLIETRLFQRMTPVYFYDYIFLLLTSILSGTFIGLWYYTKKTSRKCSAAATGGALGGFLSFGCTICNKLIVLAIGVTGALTYFAPIQPILGIVSIILLSWAVYMQSKSLSGGTK